MSCSSCGHENPPGAKLCLECGSPVAPRCRTCGADAPPTANANAKAPLEELA